MSKRKPDWADKRAERAVWMWGRYCQSPDPAAATRIWFEEKAVRKLVQFVARALRAAYRKGWDDKWKLEQPQ